MRRIIMNLNQLHDKYRDDIDSVNEWANNQYEMTFASHFSQVHSMYDKLKSNNSPISDDELEWILTWLPLELMNVSEKLSQLKNTQEVIKLGIKKKENEITTSETEGGMSTTKAKEIAADAVSEDKILLSVYDSIYERVSRQVTFAKELIMSSKKIWDARRNSEQSMPSIPSSDADALPEYSKPSTYIK